MKILLFIVHPSKYYLFRESIYALKNQGHTVDVAIVSKDVLEPLLTQGNIPFTNIFPEGRRIQGVPILLATAVNFFRTLWRLIKLTHKKKYDVFVTDDVLTIIGKLKGVPTLFFIDDDISAVPESRILLGTCTKAIAPEVTDLGGFSTKKIPIRGFKELAHLAPKYFSPDIKIVRAFNPDNSPYAIVRLVSLTASHDVGVNGIDNTKLNRLIDILKRKYRVFITAERPLSPEFEPYRLNLPVQYIAHALYFAQLYIGDSQTMTSEAAVLGTPAVRYNDFVGRINAMEVKETRYGLTFGFKTHQFEEMLLKVESLMDTPDIKTVWQEKAARLMSEAEDVNEAILKAIYALAGSR